MDASISYEGIREAATLIDPVFRDSPQYLSEPISERLGLEVILKVESVNPIRSFKGRGADFLLHKLPPRPGGYACASAGNFGQGMAYAARKRGLPMTVFAARSANPMKVERMRALGAHVELEGDDFEAAKDAATRYAHGHDAFYVEDGLLGAIGEGAGTMAVELTTMKEPLDAIFVPLGNGSLINGIGTWLRRESPSTRVIAICPAGAPSMEISWRQRTPLETKKVETIADGIAVRVPVPEALEIMRHTVDEVMLIADQDMIEAMRWLHGDAGLVIEPSGAAGLAAMATRKAEFKGRRVATILTGGNLTAEQYRRWLVA